MAQDVIDSPAIERYITAEQLAGQLGVQRRIVHAWIRAGLIPGAQLLPGGRNQYRLPADSARRILRPYQVQVA